MVRRVLTAPLHGLALGALSPVGLVQLVVVFVVGHAGMPPPTVPLRAARWRPNLYRRLVGRWSGTPVPVPYRPPPPRPEPDGDGWYRDEDELYPTPWIASFKRQWDWLTRDPATLRDHGWTVLNPVVGGVPALLPAGLIAAGAWRPLPFGVLLDTLVVRSLLVPALTLHIGHRFWWPGKPGGAPSDPVAGPSRVTDR